MLKRHHFYSVIFFGGILFAVISLLKLSFLSEYCILKPHDILYIEVSHLVKHLFNLVYGVFLISFSFKYVKK